MESQIISQMKMLGEIDKVEKQQEELLTNRAQRPDFDPIEFIYLIYFEILIVKLCFITEYELNLKRGYLAKLMVSVRLQRLMELFAR